MGDLLDSRNNRPGPSSQGRTLVIADGSLPGLVALAIASEETVRRENAGVMEPPVVWLPIQDEHADRATRKQTEAYGAVYIGSGPSSDSGSGAGAIGDRTTRSAMLLHAGRLALANGCRRVVWPVIEPGETPDEPAPVESIGNELDRALLASRLLSLDAPAVGLPEVLIETPFVDLSVRQLAELAEDLSAPLETCWWWGSGAGHASAERALWGDVLPVAAG